MSDLVRRFVAWFVGLATIAGTYLAADAIGAPAQVFWIVLGVALIATMAKPLGESVVEGVTRIRNYPTMLKEVADLKTTVGKLEQELATRKARTEEVLGLAIQEGQAQVVGAVLAAGTTPPKIRAVYCEDDDRVMLVGQGDPDDVPVGARYLVGVAASSRVLGAVQVLEVSEDGVVRMGSVDQREAEFWKELADRSRRDHAPPDGIELAPYVVSEETMSAMSHKLALETDEVSDD